MALIKAGDLKGGQVMIITDKGMSKQCQGKHLFYPHGSDTVILLEMPNWNWDHEGCLIEGALVPSGTPIAFTGEFISK